MPSTTTSPRRRPVKTAAFHAKRIAAFRPKRLFRQTSGSTFTGPLLTSVGRHSIPDSPRSGAKHDRSAGAAPGRCREGRGGILERERRHDRDLELPGCEQLGELAERAAVGLHDHGRDLDAPLLVWWVLGDRRKVTAVTDGADRVG